MGDLGLPPSLTPVLTSACSLAFSRQASGVAGLCPAWHQRATCTVTAHGSDWHKQGGAFPRSLSEERPQHQQPPPPRPPHF